MAFYDETFQLDEELPRDGGKLPLRRNLLAQPVTSRQHAHPDIVGNDGTRRVDGLGRLDLFSAELAGLVDEVGAEYEEDLDDKLDKELQKKIEIEFLNNTSTDLSPPENFAPIINTIYRSSFPQPNNFEFLKTLKLKSILSLLPEDYPTLQMNFLNDNDIKLFQLGMSGNKEPFVKISSDLITMAAKIILNPENHPILIHCNRGKHRTGCLVGVIRRLQNWSKTLIFDEYRKFAAPKERPMDLQFIELYDDTEIKKFAGELGILPLKWDEDW